MENFGEKLFSHIDRKQFFEKRNLYKFFTHEDFVLRNYVPVSIDFSVSISQVTERMKIHTHMCDSVFAVINGEKRNYSDLFSHISIDGTRTKPISECMRKLVETLNKSEQIILELNDPEKVFIFTFRKIEEGRWELHTSIIAHTFPL